MYRRPAGGRASRPNPVDPLDVDDAMPAGGIPGPQSPLSIPAVVFWADFVW